MIIARTKSAHSIKIQKVSDMGIHNQYYLYQFISQILHQNSVISKLASSVKGSFLKNQLNFSQILIYA